jgi:predicted dehydrogenase
MKPQTLGVGVVGLGYAAAYHLPALASLAPARLAAFADIDRGRLDEAGRRYGVTALFEDYRALLDRPDVEVVAILTPPASHREIAVAAIEAGKHVLLEKPIAANLADARALLEKARPSRSKVTVAYTLRFLHQIRQMRRLLQAGDLGDVELLRCSASTRVLLTPGAPGHRRVRAEGGSAAIELGVHHYDLWSHLLGSRVAEISAASRSGIGQDQTTVVTGRMTCGTLVTTCICLCGAEQYEVEAIGSQARARAALFRYDGLEVMPAGRLAGDPRARLSEVWRAVAGLPRAVEAYRYGGTFNQSFREQWDRFLDAVVHDQRPEPDLEDGLSSLEVAIAATRAIDTGETVRLPPLTPAPVHLC